MRCMNANGGPLFQLYVLTSDRSSLELVKEKLKVKLGFWCSRYLWKSQTTTRCIMGRVAAYSCSQVYSQVLWLMDGHLNWTPLLLQLSMHLLIWVSRPALGVEILGDTRIPIKCKVTASRWGGVRVDNAFKAKKDITTDWHCSCNHLNVLFRARRMEFKAKMLLVC